MTDLTITTNSELMVAHVQGETDEAVELLDRWLTDGARSLIVIDSGRIILPVGADLENLRRVAAYRNLTIEDVTQ